jgi:hypothetical protein
MSAASKWGTVVENIQICIGGGIGDAKYCKVAAAVGGGL